MSCNEPVLEVKQLTREIKNIKIIDNFSFTFYTGQIYSIIGPSGAGKSSLLRLLNRLDEPTFGIINFHGKNYNEYPPCELRKQIGYLFQTPYLFNGTVKDNIKYAAPDLSDNDIDNLVEQTKIPKKLVNENSSKLSVGEKQRVALARLMALKPEVILLDEPTSALDPTNTEMIEKLIIDIARRCEATFLFVSHNPDQAIRMGGEALLLANGRLIESGLSQQVIDSPQTEIGQLYQKRQLL